MESHKAIWSFSNKKHIKTLLFYTFLCLLILISGLIFDRHDAFPAGIVLGFGLLVYLFFKWSELIERRSRFFKKVKKQALHFEEMAMESTFIFSDNGFEYSDKEKSFKFIWSLFKPIVLYKDNILLFLKEGHVTFMISKSELGDKDYAELCNMLSDKVGSANL